jgi:hypothetical protein
MSTALESATAAVKAISASEQKVSKGNLCFEGSPLDELDEKNSVLYVIDGLPNHHKRNPLKGISETEYSHFRLRL